MSPQKSNKGKVSIENKGGYLRLRWRYQGTQHSLYTGLPDEPLSRKVAESKANMIALDILSNNFDATLEKYRQKAKPKTESRSPLELYLEFLEFKRSQIAASTARKYESLTKDLKCNPTPANIIEILSASNLPDTVKRKLEWLDQCYRYHGIPNPYSSAKKKLKIPPKSKPQPFTSEEVRLILEGFEKKYPHYLPYVQFCLSTGVRVQEARLLKWEHLSQDLTKVQILDFKRGTTRSFQLPEMAIAAIKAVEKCGDFVFTTHRGQQMKADYFRREIWKPILKAQGVDYRTPYNCRSTAISHALSKGATPIEIAAVAGHDLATLYEEYAAYIGSSPKMPDLF